MDWNGDFFYMHSNQRASDVKSCGGFYVLNHNRLLKAVVCRRRKRASSVNPRHNANFFKTEFFDALTLNNKRAVQVLAALAGKKNSF